MRKFIPLLLIVLFVGCGNAGRSINSLSDPATDTGKQFADFVSEYISAQITEKTGLTTERISSGDGKGIELTAMRKDGGGMIVLKIKELSLHSSNIFFEALEVKLVIELMVLNAEKTEIYFRQVSVEKEMSSEELFQSNKAKELVGILANNVLSQYGDDQELRRIIAKLKYGAWGNLAGFF